MARGPVIIEAAINGITQKAANPNVPRSTEEIAADALACFEAAGAGGAQRVALTTGGPLAEMAREEGVPVIGVCMGLQLLFESTSELGGAEGIGLLGGSVEALNARGLKVPQIGWNPVSWKQGSPLCEALPDPCAFYHANSFAPRPSHAGDVLATASYGDQFVSAVARHPVYGVQFHPEKSGPHGLALLGNFTRMCAAVPA